MINFLFSSALLQKNKAGNEPSTKRAFLCRTIEWFDWGEHTKIKKSYTRNDVKNVRVRASSRINFFFFSFQKHRSCLWILPLTFNLWIKPRLANAEPHILPFPPFFLVLFSLLLSFACFFSSPHLSHLFFSVCHTVECVGVKRMMKNEVYLLLSDPFLRLWVYLKSFFHCIVKFLNKFHSKFFKFGKLSAYTVV